MSYNILYMFMLRWTNLRLRAGVAATLSASAVLLLQNLFVTYLLIYKVASAYKDVKGKTLPYKWKNET